MFDGIETERAAVDDRFLIKRLNISTPFSTTDGEVRYDQRLQTATYKGWYLTGVPRGCRDAGAKPEYWFRLRGSLIKAANHGLHNNDFKDPFAILYAVDDLATYLRINPFKTPLNGLEVSATIQASNAQQVCASLVSYLNHPPNVKTMHRDGMKLPYAEIEAGQHKLKVYVPVAGSLRVEVKIDRMQYLGPDRPQTFADLVHPHFTVSLAAKLVNAFRKVVWKYPGINVEGLPAFERDLYLRGRTYEYWRVRRQDYATQAQFKCAEKQRSREKNTYSEIVRRHWLYQPPAELEQRLRQQLNRYADLMHTPVYRTLLDICLKRWQYIEMLPGVGRLPKHLELPPLSEIYTLYFSRLPTTSSTTPAANGKQLSNQQRLFAIGLGSKPEKITEISQSHQPRNGRSICTQAIIEVQAYKRQRTKARKALNIRLRRIKMALNTPGGLLCSPDDVKNLLSTTIRIALAHRGWSLEELKQAAIGPVSKEVNPIQQLRSPQLLDH